MCQVFCYLLVCAWFTCWMDQSKYYTWLCITSFNFICKPALVWFEGDRKSTSSYPTYVVSKYFHDSALCRLFLDVWSVRKISFTFRKCEPLKNLPFKKIFMECQISFSYFSRKNIDKEQRESLFRIEYQLTSLQKHSNQASLFWKFHWCRYYVLSYLIIYYSN